MAAWVVTVEYSCFATDCDRNYRKLFVAEDDDEIIDICRRGERLKKDKRDTIINYVIEQCDD